MVEMIEKLQAAASRLNTTSDEVNTSLKKIQEKLNALSLGLEVWLEDDPLSIYNDEAITKEDRDGVGVRIAREWWATQLGYTDAATGEWCLAVREMQYREDDGERAEVKATRLPQPLLQASRETRLAAAGMIERLCTALLKEAEKKIAMADNAKKVASEL